MQAAGETDADTCAYNDIGLIKLDPADYGKVNPSVPTLGGPTALGDTTATGDTVYTYGNSSLRQGVTLLSPKIGKSLGASGGGWTHLVYTVSPGIPGDSGSGLHGRPGQRVRRPLDPPARAGRRLQRRLRPAQDARLHALPRRPGRDRSRAGTEAFTGSLVG